MRFRPTCCVNVLKRTLYKDIFIMGDRRPEVRPQWTIAKKNIRKPPPNGWRPSRQWLTENFLRPPSGYEDKPKTTLPTVYESILAVAPEYVDFVSEALLVNRGVMEMAICNLLMFMMVDKEKMKHWLEETNMIALPISEWLACKADFDLARQTGWVSQHTFDLDFALKLRRATSLCGRSLDEADWAEQKENFRKTRHKPRMALEAGWWSTTTYEQLKDEKLRLVASKAVASVNRRKDTLSEWWKRRWYHTPGGSSSIDKDRVREENVEAGLKHFEVDKKVAAECYTYEEVISWIQDSPAVVARASTKHEPGFKNRALQAGNDEHSFISSYASDGMEHAYKEEGVVISQKPSDVAEWYGLQMCNPDAWQISYDYESYNMQNLNEDMALLNFFIAEAYLEKETEYALDKAICAWWTGESCMTQFLKRTGEDYRTFKGLFSGTRNTARDNSLLHQVYQHIILHNLSQLTGRHYDMKKTRKSGDDETAEVGSELEAVLYVRTVEETGFSGKRAKMLIAKGNSEFLQLALDSKRKPVYPIAPVIATFTSGNWYKQPVRDIPNIVPSLRDQIWNMVREGLDQKFGQQLLYRTADWFMQVPVDGELLKIDWMHYLDTTRNPHPLLPDKKGENWPTITLDMERKLDSNRATQDSLDSEEQWWELLDREGENLEKKERTTTSFARSIRKSLDADYCRQMGSKAKLRKSFTPVIYTAKLEEPSWTDMTKKTAGGSGPRHKQSLEEVCISMGMPPRLIRRVLGTPKFELLPAKARCKILGSLEHKKRIVSKKEYGFPPPFIAM